MDGANRRLAGRDRGSQKATAREPGLRAGAGSLAAPLLRVSWPWSAMPVAAAGSFQTPPALKSAGSPPTTTHPVHRGKPSISTCAERPYSSPSRTRYGQRHLVHGSAPLPSLSSSPPSLSTPPALRRFNGSKSPLPPRFALQADNTAPLPSRRRRPPRPASPPRTSRTRDRRERQPDRPACALTSKHAYS